MSFFKALLHPGKSAAEVRANQERYRRSELLRLEKDAEKVRGDFAIQSDIFDSKLEDQFDFFTDDDETALALSKGKQKDMTGLFL